jgi:hypothetical protein
MAMRQVFSVPEELLSYSSVVGSSDTSLHRPDYSLVPCTMQSPQILDWLEFLGVRGHGRIAYTRDSWINGGFIFGMGRACEQGLLWLVAQGRVESR